MRTEKKIHIEWFWFVALFGLLIPLFNIGLSPLWIDEAIAALPAISIWDSGYPYSPFELDFMPWQLHHGIWDPATPLYRYLLAGFTFITGFSETTARLFSWLAGVIALYPAYMLFRIAGGIKTARIGLLSMIYSVIFIEHLRTARYFTLVLCLSLFTIYYLVESIRGKPKSAKYMLVWPAFLFLTLGTHMTGYLLLPVVACLLLLPIFRKSISISYLPFYLALGILQIAIVAVFWDTLPFAHTIDCTNRFGGCHPEPFYYLGTVYALMGNFGTHFSDPIYAPSALVGVLGFAIVIMAGKKNNPATLSLLFLGLIPFVLLSTRELKYPRYLIIYFLPLQSFCTALAINKLSEYPFWGRSKNAVMVLLVAFVLLSPQMIRPEGKQILTSGYVAWGILPVIDAKADNWEKMMATVDHLEDAAENDTIVASFNDGSLSYYLNRPVVGFLNSKRTDHSLIALLEKATLDGSILWWINDLDRFNFCLSSQSPYKKVDCKQKYTGFIKRCIESSSMNGACRIVRID